MLSIAFCHDTGGFSVLRLMVWLTWLGDVPAPKECLFHSQAGHMSSVGGRQRGYCVGHAGGS